MSAGSLSAACQLCDGSCTDADLTPLRVPALRWLFEQLAAAADRRGDPRLSAGRVSLTIPVDPAARAAARGLLGGSELRPGQRRAVALSELSVRLRARGEHLTPGAAAAHVVGRPLAERSRARRELASRADHLHELLRRLHEEHPLGDVELAWTNLVRTGTAARLLAREDPVETLRTCWAVLQALPASGHTTDRRFLAQQVTGDPHALDVGAPLAGFVLGLATAVGLLDGAVRGRAAWRHLGVLGDDALGGLLAVGLAPAGWTVPAGVLLGLTPRELARARWPAPTGRGVVLITENPSVLTAVADDVMRNGPAAPVVCTSGTPSGLEVSALDALAAAGWQVSVRADFDPMGLSHVRAMLAGVRRAVPWRMTAENYLDSVDPGSPRHPGLPALTSVETPWDPGLAAAMCQDGRAAHEEALLPQLLADIRAPA